MNAVRYEKINPVQFFADYLIGFGEHEGNPKWIAVMQDDDKSIHCLSFIESTKMGVSNHKLLEYCRIDFDDSRDKDIGVYVALDSQLSSTIEVESLKSAMPALVELLNEDDSDVYLDVDYLLTSKRLNPSW